MSSYATPGDLVVHGGVPDALTDIPVPDQQAALDSASTVADGYLRSRFTLPLIPSGTAPLWPVDLVSAVCRIAYYTLLSARGFNPEQGSDSNIRSRYNDAMAWLKDVAKGNVTPMVTDSSVNGALGGPFVVQPVLSDTVTNPDGSAAIVVSAPSARGW